MIDTHAHLTHLDYNESELKKVIKRMDNNIIIASGTNDSDNKEVIDLVNNYENIYGVIGIHPTEIDKISSDSYEFIENNLNNPKIIGIGEVGLDYHYEYDKEKEKEVFITQIELAN